MDGYEDEYIDQVIVECSITQLRLMQLKQMRQAAASVGWLPWQGQEPVPLQLGAPPPMTSMPMNIPNLVQPGPPPAQAPAAPAPAAPAAPTPKPILPRLTPKSLFQHAKACLHLSRVVVDSNYLFAGGLMHSGQSKFRVNFAQFRAFVRGYTGDDFSLCIFGDMLPQVVSQWRAQGAETLAIRSKVGAARDALSTYSGEFLRSRGSSGKETRVSLIVVSDALEPAFVKRLAKLGGVDVVFMQWSAAGEVGEEGFRHVDMRKHLGAFSMKKRD